MASAPKDNSEGEGDATQGNSAAAAHDPRWNLAHKGSASLSTSNKGKERQRASSGGIQGSLLNARSPKDSSPEERSDESIQGGRDREAEPGMSTGVPAQTLLMAHAIC